MSPPGTGGGPPPGSAELLPVLEAAEEFARSAGEATLRHFGGRLDAERKADGTPVTAADREAESLLRELIGERFPDHGILGEEYGEERAGAPVRWILDPIDGTRSFARGVPLYGVLIGVEFRGEPRVGVVHFPALGETVSAAAGHGARWNAGDARVSETGSLDEALVLTTDERRIRSAPVAAGWERLVRTAAFSRTWGDCYGHALVATGRADVMVDPVLSPWDAGPLLTILVEAGGGFTDLEGDATIHGGSGVSTNRRLHGPVLELLRES